MIFTFRQDPIGPTPTLVYVESPLQDGKSSLQLDGQVIGTPSTVTEGFCAMFASFYVYGVEYPRHAKNSMHFFQQHIWKLDLYKPMPTKVQRFVNSVV